MTLDLHRSHDADIARALATPGGHLMIGRGGFTLYYGRVALRLRLRRHQNHGGSRRTARHRQPERRLRPGGQAGRAWADGRGQRRSQSAPWHSLSYAPLAVVAAAYRRIGAEVFNIPEDPEAEAEFASIPPGPTGALIDFWLDHVLVHAG